MMKPFEIIINPARNTCKYTGKPILKGKVCGMSDGEYFLIDTPEGYQHIRNSVYQQEIEKQKDKLISALKNISIPVTCLNGDPVFSIVGEYTSLKYKVCLDMDRFGFHFSLLEESGRTVGIFDGDDPIGDLVCCIKEMI